VPCIQNFDPVDKNAQPPVTRQLGSRNDIMANPARMTESGDEVSDLSLSGGGAFLWEGIQGVEDGNLG
jgi:hypothetical protein